MPATDALLPRMARAGRQLAAAVRLLARLRHLLAELAPGPALPLAGEQALAEELQQLLDQAEAALDRLAQPAPAPGAAPHPTPDAASASAPSAAPLPPADAPPLDLLDSLLADPAWDIARDLLPALEAALAGQQQAGQQAQATLQQGEVLLKRLEPAVEGARMAGAPFSALEAALFAAQSRLAALKSALGGRLHAELDDLGRLAREALAQLATQVEASLPQIEKVTPLVRQADLLIVQTARAGCDGATDDEAFDYRVVLRCAERTPAYGIPIVQDLRSLSRADRDWLTAQLRAYRGAAYRQIGPRPPPAGDPVPPASGLRRVGVFLRRMVIPDPIAEVLHREHWSFNITTNDLELPWELLCFGEDAEAADEPGAAPGRPPAAPPAAPPGDVFCLGQAVSRLPLGEAFPRSTPRRPSPSRRRRMLLVHADPDGTLTAAGAEVQAVATALAPLLEIRRLGPAQATVTALNEALIDSAWDLIHFTGHAEFDAREPARSALLLQGGRFEAGKIARLARGRPLVFLNACASAASGPAPDDLAARGLLGDTVQVAGLASAFLYSGALGCVGTLWPVVDPSAAALAVAFYERVLAGDPLGEALRVARAACWQADPAGSTWAAYVLYGDPTLRLTEV